MYHIVQYRTDTQNVSLWWILSSLVFAMALTMVRVSISRPRTRAARSPVPHWQTSQHTSTANTSDTLFLVVLSSLGILLIFFCTLPFHLALASKLEICQDRTRGRGRRAGSSRGVVSRLLILC